jgi:hypothetical protein
MQDKSFNFNCNQAEVLVLCLPLQSPGSAVAFNTLPTPSGKPFEHFPSKFTDEAAVVGSSVAFVLPQKLKKPRNSAESFVVTSQNGGRDVTGLLVCGTEWFESGRSEADVAAELEERLPQVPTEWLKAGAAACMPGSARPLRYV